MSEEAHTALSMTTMRVPISLGVEAIEGEGDAGGKIVEINRCSYSSGLIETVHTQVPQPQMSTIPGAAAASPAKHHVQALSSLASNSNKLVWTHNNPALRKRILTLWQP